MIGTLTEDVNLLIPNKEHKNFTETTDILEKGTRVRGNPLNVQGMRKGEPFVYRLFYTTKKQLIFIKPIKMETTEVKLGADSSQTPTEVNLTPAENFSKAKTLGMIIGGVLGFAYTKYKLKDNSKAARFIAIGAVLGYVAGYVVDKQRKVIIKKST